MSLTPEQFANVVIDTDPKSKSDKGPPVPDNPWLIFPADQLSAIMASVHKLASGIETEFRAVDADDLEQAVWEWIGSKPKEMSSWQYYDYDRDGVTSVRFGHKSFKRDCLRFMADLARTERRRLTKTTEDDEFVYARAQIIRHLPYVWHTSVLSAVQDRPEGPVAKQDPKFGGNGLAMAVDLRTAYSKAITPDSTQDKCLCLVHAMGYTQEEAASHLGITQQAVASAIQRGIDAIGVALNGTTGFQTAYRDRAPGPGQTLRDGPGSRKALSNQEAQRLTE